MRATSAGSSSPAAAGADADRLTCVRVARGCVLVRFCARDVSTEQSSPDRDLRTSPLFVELCDVRQLVEVILVVLATWLVLGWAFDRTITQVDGTWLVVPYLQSSLQAGTDWTDHLYRFGVVGGSKMHEFGGTMPIAQACALFGVTATTAANVITVFVQVSLAFLGGSLVQSLVALWAPDRPRLPFAMRLFTTWAIAFMPLVGWRLAYGHENLLLGLLPAVAAVSLVGAARAGRLGVTQLAVAAFAVVNGLTGLGAQAVFYAAVFGLPFALAIVLGAPRGARWSRAHTLVVVVLVASVAIALPRLSVMIAHAAGPDASRALTEPVTYSFGTGRWSDWLTSIPWGLDLAELWGSESLHERNYPVGPMLLLLLGFMSREARAPVLGLGLGLVLAIAFANDLWPISSALIGALPPLAAFRVPARAAMPVLVFLPMLAIAAVWARHAFVGLELRYRRDAWPAWGAAALALTLVVLGRHLPSPARELVAWGAAVALLVLARRAPHRMPAWQPALLATVCALGVAAFTDRFPRDLAADPFEQGAHRLRTSLLEHTPEVRSALDRVVIASPPPPYVMSTAWAAGLPSIDGVWYPPRRFLDLLGALSGAPLPPTTCVFQLTDDPHFPVLQQLYNVHYVVTLAPRKGLGRPPAPPGPAWFPRQVEIAEPGDIGEKLAGAGAELPELVRSTAWLLPGDHAPLRVDPACATARVDDVRTDHRGQTAWLQVTTPASCPLVVSTNYVSTLHARAEIDGRVTELEVFPIDIALTGVVVPPGTTQITLEPRLAIAGWARVAQLAGALALLACAALVLAGRRGARPDR